MTPTLLRVLAILIAVAGFIDPALTLERRVRPDVAVVATDSTAATLAEEVRKELDRAYTVVAAPFTSAAATILVGNTLPEPTMPIGGAGFAVVPEPAALTIEAVDAPAVADLSARTPITAQIRARNLRGREVRIALRAAGVPADQSTHRITTDDEQVRVPLQLVPGAPGATLLRVVARVDADSAVADLVVDVRQQQRTILFFDPRPSWLSTFVRRAVEADPRFVVHSRTITARSIGVDAGGPPASLDNVDALAPYDVIVVGAPELLSTTAVNTLEQYLRRRGGALLLLPDNNTRGPIDRLLSVQRWSIAQHQTPVAIGDDATLRAASMMIPQPLPAGATTIAHDSTGNPAIWESAVGAGRLIVSGALDAWRYRDPAQSQFEPFWRELLALAGAYTIPPISIDIPMHLAPGTSTGFTVTVRDALLAATQSRNPSGTPVSASLATPETRIPIRLYPNGRAGQLNGRVAAPTQPGTYELVVNANGAETKSQLIVAEHTKASRDETELLTQWTAAHSGIVIRETQLEQLRPALDQALQPERHTETTHPLRSTWWLLPFTLLLAAEWYSRRRAGLA